MNKLLPSLLLCTLASSQVYASPEPANYGSETSGKETTGLAAGFTVGVIAGGPPGALIGAAIGALIGDGWSTKNQVSELKLDLIQRNEQLAALENETQRLERLYLVAQQELDSLKTRQPQVLNVAHSLSSLSTCCDNTSLSVHFRTGSSDIEDHYQGQLESLAKLVKAHPTTRVEIIGYADRNGDATRNLVLSKTRSNHVKALFNQLGIDDTVITTIAYGETQPLDITQSVESDFFDRRVIVRLKDSQNQLLTHSPE